MVGIGRAVVTSTTSPVKDAENSKLTTSVSRFRGYNDLLELVVPGTSFITLHCPEKPESVRQTSDGQRITSEIELVSVSDIRFHQPTQQPWHFW